MQKAYLKREGTYLKIGRKGYARLIADDPALSEKLICTDCGCSVHVNDNYDAEVMASAAREVGKKKKKKDGSSPPPLFFHDEGDKETFCPQYLCLTQDPRFDYFYKTNNFDYLEKLRNVPILEAGNMQRAIEDVQVFFMRRLTGYDYLSGDDRAALDLAQMKLSSMAGVATHPWVVGYLPFMVGSRMRQFSQATRRVEFRFRGEQKLAFTSAQGYADEMTVPKYMILCFSPVGKKQEATPLARGGKMVEFPVSRDFARSVAKEAMNKRRQNSNPEERKPFPKHPGTALKQDAPPKGQLKLEL